MKDGDKSTSFFHAKATMREQINKIKGIRDKAGDWVEDKAKVEAVVDSYFQELFNQLIRVREISISSCKHWLLG